MNYHTMFWVIFWLCQACILTSWWFVYQWQREVIKSRRSIQFSVLQNDAHQWHLETFGPWKHTNSNGIENKTIEECKELIIALESFKTCNYWPDSELMRENAMEEFADIFICMSVWADRKGDSLEEAILQKMIKNKTRKWGPVGEDGTSHHVEEYNDRS